jgi:type I restriction enzyme S subunit
MTAVTWPGAAGMPQLPFKRLFKPIRRASQGDGQIVTAYTDGQVTLRSNRSKIGYHEAADTATYIGVRKGDFVVHGLDIMRGSVGVSDSDGVISPVCTVCVPIGPVEPRYAAYAMRLQAASDFPRALARGVREGGADFRRWDTLAELPLPAPPVAIQRATADYLDRETAQIDLLIAKNEELIALLTERRGAALELAIRNEASVKAPLGLLLRGLKDGTHGSFERIESAYPLLGARNVQAGHLRLDGKESTISESDHLSIVANGFPRRGDVLLVIVGATIGKAAVYELDEPMAFQRSVAFLRPGRLLTSRYLWYYTQTQTFQDEVWLRAKVSAQPGLYLGDVANIPIPLPNLSDQVSLNQRLAEVTEAVDVSVKIAKKGVRLARERRAALISAAVTGKIDVGVM